ncbi:MAG: alpha/beta fold hydrolase [Pseudomonadota bacterium]
MDAVTIVPVGSLEIVVRVWHPNAPHTVIAWHGLARHGGDFEQLARLLGPKWRVLAPDTPGRGLSSWSFYPAQEYLYAHYKKVALAVLDHFQLDSVPWVGTSMGGLLGMLLAADNEAAPRLQCLVLNDVGPELDPQALTQMATYFGTIKRFGTFNELKEALKANYQGFGIQHESEWDAMAVSSARRLPDGAWSFHYDPRIAEQFIHDTPRDMWAGWAQIHCPIMLIRGENSLLLRAESMEKMRQTQPEMETLEAPGCGHAPMLNVESQVTPLRHFLERHTPSAKPNVWQQWVERVKRSI